MKNGKRSAPAINPVIMKIQTISAPQLLISDAKVEVAIMLHFQLCSVHSMKKSKGSTSAINPVTMEITDNSHLQM